MADFGFRVLDAGIDKYIRSDNSSDSLSLGAVLKTGAGLTNSAGEVLLSGGNLQLNDSILLTVGTGDDLTISHNGTLSSLVNATGVLKIENDAAASDIVIELGDAAAATKLVLNDSGSVEVFSVDSDGLLTAAGDLDINGSGESNFAGSVRIVGSLTVEGTTTTVDSETILMSDNHLYQNAGYTAVSAQTGGLVVNYLPTATSATTAGAGVFTAGVDTTSDPTVTTDGSVFSAGDLIQISGSVSNDGLYEVAADAAGTLTIKSTANGVTDQVEDFTQDQFVAGTDTGATITKVTVSVMRAGTDGIWETGSGSVTPISFSDLSTAAASGWTDDGTTVRLTTSTDNVAIGTATALGKLTVDGDTDEIQLIVQGHSTQTSDLFVVEDSAGTDIFTIGAAQVTSVANLDASAGVDVAGANLTLAAGLDLSGAGAMGIIAAGALDFSDGNKSGSGFGTDLVLSDSSTEWDDFETAFGEVSILNAITQAGTGGDAAFVTFTETADVVLIQYDLVCGDDTAAAGNISKCDHNTTGGPFNRAIGVAAAAASAGASVEVIMSGLITVPAAQWDGAAQPAATEIGKPVYGSVTTAGEYTVTAPSASGDTAQPVGTYLGSGKVALNFQEPVEIA